MGGPLGSRVKLSCYKWTLAAQKHRCFRSWSFELRVGFYSPEGATVYTTGDPETWKGSVFPEVDPSSSNRTSTAQKGGHGAHQGP